MNLYEIRSELYGLIDAETGEIRDFEAWEELTLNREEKRDSTASWIKSLIAEADAIDTEAKHLIERRDAARRKAERLKEYLAADLDGQAWRNAHHDVRFRKSSAVEITDADRAVAWLMANDEEALTYQMPKISKTVVKDLIKNGAEIPGAELVERHSITIK